MRRLILASSSIYRQSLLRRLGLPFVAIAPEIDETPHVDELPRPLCRRLARTKASAIANTHADALVIGSDQIAVVDGQIFGKPGSAERAIEQLKACAGREMQLMTGLAVVDSTSGHWVEYCVSCLVRFRKLSLGEIEHYVATERPLDCAASFKAEGLGISLFDAIESDDPTTVIGFPLIHLCRALREHGVALLSPEAGLTQL